MRISAIAVILFLSIGPAGVAVQDDDDFKQAALDREFDRALSLASEDADKKAVKLAAEALDTCIKDLAYSGKVSIKYWQPDGRSKSAKGLFGRFLGRRIMINTGRKPMFVEIKDIEGDSLLKIFQDRLKRYKVKDKEGAEAEKIAYLLLFSGLPKLAKRALKKNADRIPEAYWKYAEELGPKLAQKRKSARSDKEALKLEQGARELFYDALAASMEKDTIGESVQKFTDLKANFADAPIVKENLALIENRGENAGQFTLIPASGVTKAEGIWKLKKVDGSIEPKAWWAKRDGTAQNYRKSPLEAAYWVKKDVTYRVYVRAFVCCKEVATLLYQGTNFKIKPKDKSEMDIGMNAGTSGRTNPPSGLPDRGTHGKKKHKWMWIPIMNGHKSLGTGLKEIRIMSEIGDMAISHILVLPSSESPPKTDEELMRKLREW